MKDLSAIYPSAYIPYRAWGGSWFPAWHTSPLAEVDIARFAAEAMPYILSQRNIPINQLDYLITGSTVPWLYKFWASPYLSHCFGQRVPGFHLEQACATGLQVVIKAAAQVQAGAHSTVGVLAFDRTSNSPAAVFPTQGSYRRTEVISDIWDNFGFDPATGQSGFKQDRGETSMMACAGRAARKHKLDFNEVAEIAFWRYQQYDAAKKAGILNQFLFPLKVLDVRGQLVGVVDDDLGVRKYSSSDQIKAERQIVNCVSPGTQTHASDGMFTLLMTSKDKARELSARPEIEIQLVGTSEHRGDPGFMPEAPVIAVQKLLARTGLSMNDFVSVYGHNPFVVTDLMISKLLNHDWKNMNNTGCPMVYGHPQGPTLIRVLVEALENAVAKGGGYVLLYGCAAGDVGISAIFKVTEKKGGN